MLERELPPHSSLSLILAAACAHHSRRLLILVVWAPAFRKTPLKDRLLREKCPRLLLAGSEACEQVGHENPTVLSPCARKLAAFS